MTSSSGSVNSTASNAYLANSYAEKFAAITSNPGKSLYCWISRPASFRRAAAWKSSGSMKEPWKGSWRPGPDRPSSSHTFSSCASSDAWGSASRLPACLPIALSTGLSENDAPAFHPVPAREHNGDGL